MINWMKFRFLYFGLSLLVILPGLYSLARFGLKLSIEFTGGSLLVYQDFKEVPDTFLETMKDYSGRLIAATDKQATFKLKDLAQKDVEFLTDTFKVKNPDLKIVSFETLGPALGQETIKKTIFAILLASLLLLLHISRAFREFKFGLSAILAMLHDSLVLLGSFSLLGHFFNLEVDLLFVTAVLTVLSFSVHDTIVVYDRIRELKKRDHLAPLSELANRAVSETMVRSLVNSLTIIFMLLALVLMGGDTTRNFALALLIGTISGSYSSPFTAVPLLLVFDRLFPKR